MSDPLFHLMPKVCVDVGIRLLLVTVIQSMLDPLSEQCHLKQAHRQLKALFL